MIDEKMLIEILSKNSIFEKITNAEGKNVFEIIDDLPKIEEKNCGDCSRRKFYQEGYQDGLNADKWISCSGTLPIIVDEPSDCAKDVGRRFLITDSDGYVYDSTFWKYANAFDDDAIAWQPLPTAYKGEQE